MGVAEAARAVGQSVRWGYQQAEKAEVEPRVTNLDGPIIPEPMSLEDLDPNVVDTLKDFSLFRQVFLCRDAVPWAKEAGERTVEYLLDREHKSYVVMNEPPGVGKTTTFTFDLPLWLICGGGIVDPAKGRAIRIMLGSEGKKVAVNFVRRLRNTLQSPRPFYDKNSDRRAEMSLIEAFGRFRPTVTKGEDVMWRADQFLVAQMAEMDVYEKEPTVQAASRESGFLGERVALAVWDDLVTKKNSNAKVEIRKALAEWTEDEAESRIEPGGLFLLVGQRLGPNDLYANRKKATYIDHEGNAQFKYQQVIFPAHKEEQCPGGGTLSPKCFQWEGDKGCLLDAYRLSWHTLQQVSSQGTYRTVYQQEDSNPDDLLVQKAWIEGGLDSEGVDAPGCLDSARSFWEWPENTLSVTYATVRPAEEGDGFWATEVWSADVHGENRALIYGERRKMRVGLEKGLIDFDPHRQVHVGLMEDLQVRSGLANNPIRIWIMDSEILYGFLFRSEAYKTWARKWPKVTVLPHELKSAKEDHRFSVDALLGMPYRLGLKRLPGSNDPETQNYVRRKVEQLTSYPMSEDEDLVLVDWYGECNYERVRKHKAQLRKWAEMTDNQRVLPPHLRNRIVEVR
jgi:hypothetical protein